MSIEAMKQALEALEWNLPVIEDYGDKEQLNRQHKAITALRQAIQEEALRNVARLGQEIEQEPKCVVIVEVFEKDWRLKYMSLPVGRHKLYAQQYLYTHPQPKREWVGLTPDEVFRIADQHPVEGFDPDIMAYTRAIEAKLKEKNT